MSTRYRHINNDTIQVDYRLVPQCHAFTYIVASYVYCVSSNITFMLNVEGQAIHEPFSQGKLMHN